MAKSKHAPALFEVIEKPRKGNSGSRVALPKWWKNRTEGAPPGGSLPPAPALGSMPGPESVVGPSGPGLAGGQGSVGPIVVHAPAPVRGRVEIGGGFARHPIFRIEDGRVEISLNPVNACVLVGVLLLALFTCYQLGQVLGSPGGTRTAGGGQPEAADPFELAMSEPARPGVLGTGLLTAGRRAANEAGKDGGSNSGRPGREGAAVGQAVVRDRSLNYVVLDHFGAADREDAEHARDWLAEQGVATTLEATSDDTWLLVTVVGFEYSKEEEKAQREKMIGLGKQYVEAFKGEREIRYRFHDPFIKKWSKSD